MAHKPIAANLLMVILLLGGLWTAFTMQKEVFPEFQLDIVSVSVAYPGAAPSEVEQGILLPIEETVRGVEGIKEITSTAREGSGTVTIELVAGAERMKVFQDIDQAVARIRTFPDDIEEPEVSLASRQQEVVEVVLYGGNDVWTLRKLAERLRDVLLSDKNITQVELGNAPKYITHVEIPRDVLREYGITLADVSRIIEQSSKDIPAGAIETKTGEILLRLKERKEWAKDFAQIEIIANSNGATVHLSEIASIYDGFEEGGFHSQFNAQPSVELNIYRVGSQSPLVIADALEKIMEDFETTLAPGIQWRIDNNNAEEYRDRMSLLIKNALLAVLIVFVILTLFLELHLAFWVMMGMAVSFFGGLMLMPAMDVSLNMISMFGFLLVLGIVVDDAIVVGENIYEERQRGIDKLQAAIIGTKKIALPVIISILSNIVAFLPLFFMPGETGKFWWPLPTVVIIILLVSLFEALFILPAHLGHSQRFTQKSFFNESFHRFQQNFAKIFDSFVNTYYARLLSFCLKFRYITISTAIAVLIVVGAYASSAHMGMIMMPEVAADEIEAGVRLPVGTTIERAAEVAEEITASTLKMFDEYDLYKVAEGVKTNVRGQNFIDVEIVMRPPDERDMGAAEVIQLWRDNIGDITGIDQITFEAESGPGGWRQDISVDLSHNNIEVLERASKALVERLNEFTNTSDVNDNFNKGKEQIDVHLTPEGRALGFTSNDIGEQLRGAFYGDLALRHLRTTNEIEIRVKLPREERKDLYHLNNLILRAPSGAEVPLMDIAKINRTEAFIAINRRDGRRMVRVSTDVEPKREITQVIKVLNEEVLPQLRADFPGITWSFQGSQAKMRESTQELFSWFLLAIGIIYALLAVTFNSYLQPIIVLTAIPFGVIGAVMGHIFLGYDLSLISLMGVVALSGVVVNDSLIMVDYANKRRSEESAYQAIYQAGLRRFRPIALTTLTTFGGLTPLILERSLQAQYLIPMAISLGFGILFATAIILVLVPCFYMALEDIKLLRKK
ncbi:MAG: multidrug transporter [Waddliaceae bacterium]|nr:multidrug transporter [Waddliaceae bacterium]